MSDKLKLQNAKLKIEESQTALSEQPDFYVLILKP